MESSHGDSEDIQQALLDKLMQYGDSLLDTEDYEQRKAEVVKKKKKKHKKEQQPQDSVNLPGSSKGLPNSKLKKRKKLKGSDTDDHQSQVDANADSLMSDELKKRKRKGRTQREFEEELRIFKEARDIEPVESKEEDIVKKSAGPEVIVFEDPAKRKKKKSDDSSQSSESNFDLNKARLEVQKFGYSGFDYADRKKFEQERAIRLGAKPPKRDYVNYKLYMEQLKQKRAEEQKQKEIDRKLGLKASSSKSTDTDVNKTVLRHHGFWKDRSTEKGFHLDGQVGRYRPGVLWLTRKDIVGVTGKSKKTGNKSSTTDGNSNRRGKESDRTGSKSNRMNGKSNRK